MTTYSTSASPQQLFRELEGIGNVAFGMLTGPQVSVRRWPPFYLAYVEVEGLCWEMSRATGFLSRGFIMQDGAPDPRRILEANACLDRIGTHACMLVELLARIERYRLASHSNRALQHIVQFHFSRDSAWYAAFQGHYCAGRVLANGHTLERRVLAIDPQPVLPAAGATHITELQLFDLAPVQSCTRLGHNSRQVQSRLNQVYAAMGAFFVANCPSVADLLHPRLT